MYSYKKKILRGIIFTFVIGIIVGIVIIAGKIEKSFDEREINALKENYDYDNFDEEIVYNGKNYKLNSNIETMLLVGVDDILDEEKSIQNSTSQADFIALLVIDNEKKTYQILYINRDTVTDINIYDSYGSKVGREKHQIGLAYGFGNSLNEKYYNLKWALENYLYGIKINNYIVFTMDAVPIVNDFVGGVRVKVKDDFSKIDSSLRLGENVTLKGQQALTFVRSRKNMALQTNINRMSRQEEYINAFLERLKESVVNDETVIRRMLNSVSRYCSMSINLNEVNKINNILKEYTALDNAHIEGESVNNNGFMEYVTNENSLMSIILVLFYE